MKKPKPSHASKPLPSAFKLFKPSIKAIMLNVGTWLLLAFTPVLAIMPFFIIAGMQQGFTSASAIILLLAVAPVILIVAPAVIYLSLRSVRGHRVGYLEAFNVGFSFALRYAGLSITIALVVIGGLILFIIPGVIMYRRYFLAGYFMIDEDISIKESMEKSAESSKPYASSIYGVIGVSVLLGLISIIRGLGEIIGGIGQALYGFAPAVRYEQIRKARNKSIKSQA